ncbi:unnamed protein product [Candidula unifasciata]|uniref:Uncharacterized protein n=1 Tax=Candidula unifasciata TaxID=100452 RepID=A0A8S3ZA02_9EUPU|nr:unnamed protein product [Candidula unifasciata]
MRSRQVIGSLVTDFDLVDDGQTVELSGQSIVPDNGVDLAPQVTPIYEFLGRVYINGDVNLTFISNSQSQYRDNRISSTYHCKLSNDKTNAKLADSGKSVKMFRKK